MANVDAYNIARDSRQDLNVRREAASHLTQAQKKQLQTELLKLVPGFDVKTGDAIWLLAEVGDMAAVERLEEFKRGPYEIPGKINYAASIAIEEIVKRQLKTNRGDLRVSVEAYNMARDSKRGLHARREAASHLTQDQKQLLQTELLREVPGKLDTKTNDAIWVLAEVGDMAAAERLEQFRRHTSFEIPDRIDQAASLAIDEIRNRELKTDR